MGTKNKAAKIGRPSIEFSIEANIDQLVAPLIMPKPSWNSVDVAKFTGLSQSTISRTWQNAYPIIESPISKFRSLDLLALNITNEGTVILFEYAPKLQNAQNQNEHFMRSTKRRAFQVVLASSLLTDRISQTPDYTNLINFVMSQNSDNFLFISSGKLPNKLKTLNIKTVEMDQPNIWHGSLHDLVNNANLTKQETLDAIQFAIMPWARNPRVNYYWQKPSPTNEIKINNRTKPLALNQVLSDQAFNLILSELRLGRLSAGDRITESYLAKHLHTSRNQARDAIKNLASSGLLEFPTSKIAVIPTPSIADVIDIYEARRALGGVIFRRAAQMQIESFVEARRVLDRMMELGRLNNALDTGLHDLLFQETIAENTGMRNFYEMMRDLASQLRLFIEILGLNYMYDIDDMCNDNRRIFDAIMEKDEAKVLAAWNKKMHDAQVDMTKKIQSWKRQN